MHGDGGDVLSVAQFLIAMQTAEKLRRNSQTLRIEHMEMSDQGMYQCVVSNSEETAQGTSEIRLGDSPPALVSAFSGALLQPGAAWSAAVRVVAAGRAAAEPLRRARGTQGRGKVHPENHRQQVFPNRTLVIKVIRKHADEGGYVCVATNPLGQTSRSKMNVLIMEAPEIDPIVIKHDLQLGMRMRLACVVSKGDFTIQIQWLKDGSPIAEDQQIAEKILDEYSSTLSFCSLAVKHNGNYTCQASNAAASRNYTVKIIVNGNNVLSQSCNQMCYLE
ncbi:Down syndrome cell adhesion molecule-like protein Dscam2 [Schistocerca gregaria]|uniref:Down syndrome cell adhesion molecule-like protein Dscam2 n=1 Tax=Schistocerca gregaria TaxID=7010 RepID=UPI00211E918E|nr:Down syndrome cell adhesion molecule-like protein Dscam2 [Schistocerca gregaria]